MHGKKNICWQWHQHLLGCLQLHYPVFGNLPNKSLQNLMRILGCCGWEVIGYNYHMHVLYPYRTCESAPSRANSSSSREARLTLKEPGDKLLVVLRTTRLCLPRKRLQIFAVKQFRV